MATWSRGHFACLLWTLVVLVILLSSAYVTSCVAAKERNSVFCPYLEAFTLVTLLTLLSTIFWYCYRRKLANEDETEDPILDPLPIFYDERQKNLSSKPKLQVGDNIKIVDKEDIPADFECIICNEEASADTVVNLSCNHFFHHNCVTKWFSGNDEYPCPVCRTSQRASVEKLVVITIVPRKGGQPLMITRI